MEKMPENEKVILIHRYLSGGMEEPEKQQFETWLANDPHLVRLKDEYALLWATAAQSATPVFDSQKGYQEFRLKTRSNRRLIQYTSAAAVILLFILAGVYLITRSVPMRDIIADVPLKETLEDGSRLELRTHAHLRVPESFNGRIRKVEMVSGEAFFDIAADPGRPFKIEHEYGLVEVVGTEFIIVLDTTTHEFALHVLEGEVTFTPDLSDNVARVRAGESILFDADTRILEPIEKPNPNAVSWYTGTLSFINTPVKQVVDQLMHHYALEISLTDEHVGNCLFTSPQPYQDAPVRVILDALCTTYGMQLKEETGAFVLAGGKCQ